MVIIATRIPHVLNVPVLLSTILDVKDSALKPFEQEVRKVFPTANVKRFDADSTSRKNAHQHILEAFQHQEELTS